MAADETQEPTLRRGDHSLDGWVEYAQALLNQRLSFDSELDYRELSVDGDFGNRTHNAVVAFQRHNDLAVDGIVGNQTWAALRGEVAQTPGTDGRARGTFVEHGFEARWFMEDWGAVYWIDDDRLVLTAVNTGTDPIAGDNVLQPSVTVINNGAPHALDDVRFHHDAGHAVSGDQFVFVFDGLRSTISDLEPYRLEVHATMPPEYGGDVLATAVTGLPPEPPLVPDIVTSGAPLMCTFGTIASQLTVLQHLEDDRFVHSTATVQDFRPVVNIPPFGMCTSPNNPEVQRASIEAGGGSLVHVPCMPEPIARWVPGAPQRLVDGEPVLTMSSTCTCAWSGSIMILGPGDGPSIQDR